MDRCPTCQTPLLQMSGRCPHHNDKLHKAERAAAKRAAQLAEMLRSMGDA